jgi:hypothetical protein
VVQSQLTVRAHAELGVRYHLQSLPEPKRRETEDDTLLQWSVENLSPVSDVAYGPHFSEWVPKVLLAPTTFQMDKYGGDMSTWQDFGQCQAQLVAGRDALPAEVQTEVQALVADASS